MGKYIQSCHLLAPFLTLLNTQLRHPALDFPRLSILLPCCYFSPLFGSLACLLPELWPDRHENKVSKRLSLSLLLVSYVFCDLS